MEIADKNIQDIRKLVKVQCSDGNWNYDEYMHGMANGMILIKAIIDDVEPVYLDAPDVWVKYVPGDKMPALGNQKIGNI